MFSHIKHAGSWAVVAALVFITCGIATLIVGPHVEKKLFPVFKDVRSSFVSFEEDRVDILVTGLKARNCQLSSSSAQVYLNDQWVEGVATMLKADGTVLKIEDQRIGLGQPFVRKIRVTPASSHIRISIDAICHPLWPSRQDLLELDLSKTPAQVR